MKKLFALLLAGIMMLSLAACGAKDQTPANSTDSSGTSAGSSDGSSAGAAD